MYRFVHLFDGTCRTYISVRLLASWFEGVTARCTTATVSGVKVYDECQCAMLVRHELLHNNKQRLNDRNSMQELTKRCTTKQPWQAMYGHGAKQRNFKESPVADPI